MNGTAAGYNAKVRIDLLQDSNVIRITYAKSLIDTATHLIKPSIGEKVPSNQQVAPVMEGYFRAFRESVQLVKWK